MLAVILVFILLSISVILIRYKGVLGWGMFFMLCGSVTDSAGILYFIDSFFPYYKIFIWLTTFSLMFYSIYLILFRIRKRVFIYWYFLPFSLSLLFVIGSKFVNNYSWAEITTTFILSGIPFFFIWYVGRYYKGQNQLIVYLILFHCISALIIIVGKSSLSEINGLSYIYRVDEDFQLYDFEKLINSKLYFFNFNKYEVQKFGQFHNSNALGFFSIVSICVGIASYFRIGDFGRVNEHKIIAIMILIISIILWFNSLTRGPLVFLFLVFAYIYTRPWKIRKNKVPFILFLLFGLVVIVTIEFNVLSFILPDKDNVSVTSRFVGYINGFNAISNNPLWGQKFDGSPPHIYPLKIASYYGVPAGLLIFIPIVHLTYCTIRIFIKEISLKKINESTFAMMLLATLLGVYITNGTVSNVLFGIIMAEILIRINLIKEDNQEKDSAF
ncbi:hypothetical protein [Aquiflexum sp.]|uniref:hypothetical protein n=1 Tax=Aquiflexum sp. TaxID=1872584 RepID=UPI003593276B